MAGPVIFSGSDVKTLKSNIDLFGNAKILSGSVDPTSSATSAPKGSIYLNTSTGNIYRKTDAGSSTNWVIVAETSAAGDLLPSSDISKNIGSASLRWLNLFVQSISSAAGVQIDIANRALQFNGTNIMSWFTGGMALFANKVLRFTDGVGTHSIDIAAPGTSANMTITLPTALPGTSGQALVSDTSGNLSFSSFLSTALNSAQIFVGNGSNVATAVSVTGDIAITNAGVTSYSGVVPLNKGGTGTAAASANAAFNALSPMTTAGDIIYGGASGAATRLAGAAGVLQGQVAGAPSFTQAPTLTTPSMTTPTISTSINLTGGQITFPATQVASAGANVLDDYEEGTFTPTIVGTTTPGTGTYGGQIGQYTKIGNVVYFIANIGWSAHTGTGNMRVGGLPFTIGANAPSITVGIPSNITLTASNTIFASGAETTTQIILLQSPVGGGAETNVAIDTSAGIFLSGFYFV